MNPLLESDMPPMLTRSAARGAAVPHSHTQQDHENYMHPPPAAHLFRLKQSDGGSILRRGSRGWQGQNRPRMAGASGPGRRGPAAAAAAAAATGVVPQPAAACTAAATEATASDEAPFRLVWCT